MLVLLAVTACMVELMLIIRFGLWMIPLGWIICGLFGYWMFSRRYPNKDWNPPKTIILALHCLFGPIALVATIATQPQKSVQ